MQDMSIKTLFKFMQFNNVVRNLIKRSNHSKSICLHPDLEREFNNQIRIEFFASFVYLALACFFGRRNISLPGCCQFFMNQVIDEREHAHKIINYLSRRGSQVELKDITAPKTQTWDSPLSAFKDALDLESFVSEKINQLHKLAEQIGDASATSLLEDEFIDTQVEEFDKISRYVSQLEQIGADQSGIFIFDRYLLKDMKKEAKLEKIK